MGLLHAHPGAFDGPRRRASTSASALFLLLLPALAASATSRPVGPEIMVTADGAAPAVAATNHRVLVAWATTAEPRRVRARAFDLAGSPVGPEVDLGAYAAAPDGSGGRVAAAGAHGVFVVAWNGPRADGVTGVFVRRLDSDGGPVGPAELVSGDGPRARFDPDVAAIPGSYAVSWTADRSPVSFYDVFARRFHLDGRPDGSAFLVNEKIDNFQGNARVALTTDGLLVVVWESFDGEPVLTDIYGRTFGPDGVPREGAWRVNSDPDFLGASQTQPVVAALDGGSIVVAWEGLGQDVVNGADAAIVGRLFRHGTRTLPETGDLVLNERPAGDQRRPSITALPKGGFTVAWQVDCGGDCGGEGSAAASPGVFARNFHEDGSPNGGDYPLAVSASGLQSAPVIAAERDIAPPPAGWAVWRTADDEQAAPGVVLRRLAITCTQDDVTLCLGDGRFAIRVDWGTLTGSGFGTPVVRGRDWGTMWFFRPSNVELAIKILDGRAVNGHFWLFYASLTDVVFGLRVMDLYTGRVVHYSKAYGEFASVGDTTALPAPPSVGDAVIAPPALAPPLAAKAPAAGGCSASPTRACLQGGRFAVEIEWEDFFGNQGTARRANLTTDTAYFWFFREGNPEIVVKVLDGRPVNGRFWVFFGSVTNVGFRLRVTDTATGQVAVYDNPLHNFASVGDAAAFPR